MANFLFFPGSPGDEKLLSYFMEAGAQVYVMRPEARREEKKLPAGIQDIREPEEPEELATLLQTLRFDCAVDAGHCADPQRSENRKAACAYADLRYLRLARFYYGGEECVSVESAAKAAGVLSATKGSAFLSVGLGDLEAFTEVPEFRDRIYLRISPSPENIAYCRSLGFRQENIFGIPGALGRELGGALIRRTGASILVTRVKDPGQTQDKLLAARDAGATALVIGRLAEKAGLSAEELLEILKEDYQVYLPEREMPKRPHIPLFVDLSQKRMCLFGGGAEAARTAEALLRFGEHLSVIAPQFDPAFDKLDVARIERPYMRGDCEGCDCVFAMTDNREVNHAIYEEARQASVPVYVYDAFLECTFLLPEIVCAGGYVAGILAGSGDKKRGQSAARAIGEQLCRLSGEGRG